MSDMIYRPLIEGMTWSFSRVKCFEDCPYRWYMKYICDLPEEPRFYSSYGSFMHKLLESFYSGNVRKEDLPARFLCGFSENVQGDRPSEKIVSDYIDQGLSYLKSFIPLDMNVLAVEKRFDFEIGGVPFVGYADLIGEKNGEIYVVDHKSKALSKRSGRSKPTKNDEEIDLTLRQLYIYADAVRQEYGSLPSYLCINCFRNGNVIVEPFDRKAYEETLSWAKRSVESIMDENDFHPWIEFFQCKYLCGLSDECCYWKEGGGS